MTHFELTSMTKITLGHLINTLGHKEVWSEDSMPSNDLIVKHAIDLAEEACKQLDARKSEEEQTTTVGETE